MGSSSIEASSAAHEAPTTTLNTESFAAPRILSVPPHLGPSLAPSPVVPWRPLLPLLPPRASIHSTAVAPPPPSRPRVTPPPGFVRSVHASPAAWPRSFAESRGDNDRYSRPYSSGPPASDRKEREKQIAVEKVTCGELPKRAREWDIDEAAADPSPPHPQWLAVERWRREQPVEGGVTLLLMHANGMPKEDYHPTLRRLLASPAQEFAFGTGAPLPSAGVVVNDIFLLEDTLHGVSQDLNAGHLPAVHAWADLARDILNFVLHVLPAMSDDAPWQLEWVANPPKASRRVFGVGHSLGGNALVHASVTRPDAFEGLFLIDPMTQPTGANSSARANYPAQAMTLRRRAAWPSRTAAAETQSNAMFSRFDPEVFALWLEHGVVRTGNGEEVHLATPPWAEACVFSDPRAPQRGWDLLPQLQVPVGFCMAQDTTWMGGDKIQRELVWRPKRARNEMVEGAGHLVVQEKPTETAAALSRFLNTLQAGVWDTERSRL